MWGILNSSRFRVADISLSCDIRVRGTRTALLVSVRNLRDAPANFCLHLLSDRRVRQRLSLMQFWVLILEPVEGCVRLLLTQTLASRYYRFFFRNRLIHLYRGGAATKICWLSVLGRLRVLRTMVNFLCLAICM